MSELKGALETLENALEGYKELQIRSDVAEHMDEMLNLIKEIRAAVPAVYYINEDNEKVGDMGETIEAAKLLSDICETEDET